MVQSRLDQRAVALGSFPVVLALLTWGIMALIKMPVALQLQGDQQQWFLRSYPLVNLALPPLLVLLPLLILPRHLRGLPAQVTACILMLAGAYYGWSEYSRQTPYGAQYGWDYVLRFADPYMAGGFALGFVAVVFSAKLSLSAGDPFKRAKNREFGDADWMKMDDAARLSPETGRIVVGERYRPDLDSVQEVGFKPSDRATWGKGGSAPLLTFGANFGSTHSLIFAGSGGFKTAP
jgi:type IV secretion system protein VirD4